MRISDIILDRLSETKLYEMVRERQRAMDTVRNLADTVVEHCSKILMYGDTRERSVWISELGAYSDQIIAASARFRRKTGRSISSDRLLDIMMTDDVRSLEKFQQLIEDIDRRVNRIAVKRNLPVMKIVVDHEIIHRQILEILSRISSSLEEGEIPDFEAIFSEIVDN